MVLIAVVAPTDSFSRPCQKYLENGWDKVFIQQGFCLAFGEFIGCVDFLKIVALTAAATTIQGSSMCN